MTTSKLPTPKNSEAAAMLADREWLIDQYKTRSMNSIAKEIGVSDKTVKKYLVGYGVEIQNRNEANKKVCKTDEQRDILNDKSVLANMYQQAGSIRELARRVGITSPTMKTYLLSHDIDLNLENPSKFSHIEDENRKLLFDDEWLKSEYDRCGSLKKIAKRLGITPKTVSNRLRSIGVEVRVNKHPLCAPLAPNYDPVSEHKTAIISFIKSLGFEVDSGNRTILGGLELDAVIHEKKIAFEFNGVYWHSSKFMDNNYHKNKTVRSLEAGYRLIHIFEDEWIYRQEQVKSKIKSVLGVDDREVVYARKCTISQSTDSTTIEAFLNANHIQGHATHSFAFSLYHEGSVVACMTFKKRSDSEYELNRYATSKRVVGGFSKLTKTAKDALRKIGASSLVSFADVRYSDGNLYTKNGWSYEYTTPPDYQYVFGDKRVRKQNFRRKDLAKKLANFDQSLSETENMTAHGHHRIYDCGLMKFSMSI